VKTRQGLKLVVMVQASLKNAYVAANVKTRQGLKRDYLAWHISMPKALNKFYS